MISKLFTPTFRLSIGLVGLTICLVLSANALKLMPDERSIELDARLKIAESLAIHLSNAASRNEINSLREVISTVVKRNDAIRSIAFRRTNGEILISAGGHEQHWAEPSDQNSTLTYVQIPLKMENKDWGKFEIAFTPIQSGDQIVGIPKKLGILMLFLGAFGFVGYYFLLNRVLRELHPGNVIPERVQAAFNTLAEGVLILDDQNRILLANNSFAATVNKAQNSLIGSKIADLQWKYWGEKTLAKEYPWQLALRDQKNVTAVKMAYGSSQEESKNFIVNAACIHNKNGTVSGVIVTFDDVTDLEYKNAELNVMVDRLQKKDIEIRNKNRELHILATRDPLTNCLNRRAFFEGFDERIENIQTNDISISCMMIDLDCFKIVNDTYGHAIGDEVIKLMGNIVKSIAGNGDIAGRYGGEEFCVVLFGYTREDVLAAAEKIRISIIEDSKKISALKNPITTSIGVATAYGAETSPVALLDLADKALYTAKSLGRDRVIEWENQSAKSPVYSDNISQEIAGPMRLEKATEELRADLRDALDNDGLSLHYQPIIDLKSCNVRSMEVLLRFENEELREHSVEKLIAIAEQSGLIIEIGQWVLETAISQYQHWTSTSGVQPMIAINISGVQITDRNASKQIVDTIRNKMDDPSKLEVEITESAIIHDVHEAKIMFKQLQGMGVRVILDDFGTGYSSLKYIKEFQPDGIKIDQYFMKNFDQNNSDRRLVAAIIAMARNLKIDIVAEGIENTSQLDNIMFLHCDYGQGYLFSRPMPVSIVPEWLQLFSDTDSVPFPIDKAVAAN